MNITLNKPNWKICETCGKQCDIKESCKCETVSINGKIYSRYQVGKSPQDKEIGPNWYCPDCGVKNGGYHQPGCDFEICPECGKQFISCECEKQLIIPD